MERPQSTKKEKKGLARLWAKVKLAIRPKSKSKNTASIGQTSNIQSSTQTPQPSTAERSLARNTQLGRNTRTESVQPPQSEPISQLSSVTPAATELIHHTTTMEPSIQPEKTPEVEQQPSASKQQQPILTAVTSASEKDELTRRYERAQAIFKKYNLEFDDVAWEIHPKETGERIQKSTRMRVRWTCHECKTTFGHDRTCVECAHQRCKNCVRYPPKKKKTKAAKQAAFSKSLAEPEKSEVQKGACHECQTAFDAGSQECPNCHHLICDRCLKEMLASVEQDEAEAVAT